MTAANLCNRAVQTICDLLDEFAPPVSGRRRRDLITYVEDRRGHDKRYAIDASKISRDLGWLPSRTFEIGIRDTVEWYLKNSWWWQDILDRGHHVERLGLGAKDSQKEIVQ
ncbi:GDP-mannose 4,6-dehydratase [Pseudomonas aeruginosa]|nr:MULTISPECIES: GDP-mannose 4,6-dehydratase [Pseudomonas]MBG7046491.1 GDP-mannose 4,6-dehydratase [Pseudomonas aeruginosa]QKF06490.1 hypothetical protein HPT09_06035 [Pseudomonas aeruginosa]WPD48411.1 GDP-mannose 4,6-dehydratase [Pseudomonas aeruginosa]